jgi:hypothetical protein
MRHAHPLPLAYELELAYTRVNAIAQFQCAAIYDKWLVLADQSCKGSTRDCCVGRMIFSTVGWLLNEMLAVAHHVSMMPLPMSSRWPRTC